MRWKTRTDEDDWYDEDDEPYDVGPYVIVERRETGIGPFLIGLALGAQAMTIPGIDLAALPLAKRTEALQKLNAQPCTCGCDLTVARCRVDGNDGKGTVAGRRRYTLFRCAARPRY